MISRRNLILGSAAALAVPTAGATPGSLSFGWTFRTGGLHLESADLSRQFPVPMWQILREPADEWPPEDVAALFRNIAKELDIEIVDWADIKPAGSAAPPRS